MLLTSRNLNKDHQILRGLWVRGVIFAPPPCVEDADPPPPSHPATNQEHPAVPVIGKMIAYVARVSMAEGIPAAGWAVIPPAPGS